MIREIIGGDSRTSDFEGSFSSSRRVQKQTPPAKPVTPPASPAVPVTLRVPKLVFRAEK